MSRILSDEQMRSRQVDSRSALRTRSRTWAGRGSGASCHLCSASIESHEVEYEVEMSDTVERRVLLFHFECYRQWALAGA